MLINARLLDQSGHPVLGLDAANFHILEGGVEQKIVFFNQADTPVSMVLVVDISNSMRKLIARSAEAVSSILRNSNPEDEFSVVEFSDHPSLALNWTADTSKVRDCLLRAKAGGNTGLLDAVRFAGEIARRATNPRRVAIVISDGMDNRSRRSVGEVKRYLLEANLEIYAIDILNYDPLWSTPGDADGPELLETICGWGGGRRVVVEPHSNLTKAIEKIGREIRNEYILGYQPPGLKHPGKYHRVDLKLSGAAGFDRVSVSWRRGYYEPRGEY